MNNNTQRRMLYFIPWWDDYVDLNYDFRIDRPTDGGKVTAHHLFKTPPYDGILVSKVKIEGNRRNMKRIEEVGIHKFLDFAGPVFGDCGAYGYLRDKTPPYSSTDIAEYYDRLGFDYGVSVDHLIVKAVEDEKYDRFELTLRNAEQFIQEHERRGFDYIPVGAVQGWNPTSYQDGVKELLDMGYDYIAIGGLTRSQTREVLRVLEGIHEIVENRNARVNIHLFGLARLTVIRDLYRLGVTSFDSASYLRRAWLGADSNYMLPGGKGYAAIRIPQTDRSPKAKKILQDRGMSFEELAAMEQACMDLLRMYDQDRADIDEVLEAVLWYDELMGDTRNHADAYRQTLIDRPWKACNCEICKSVGIEVIVFRGNNRNRRRGFHNTKVFYEELQRVLETVDEPDDQTLLGEF